MCACPQGPPLGRLNSRSSPQASSPEGPWARARWPGRCGRPRRCVRCPAGCPARSSARRRPCPAPPARPGTRRPRRTPRAWRAWRRSGAARGATGGGPPLAARTTLRESRSAVRTALSLSKGLWKNQSLVWNMLCAAPCAVIRCLVEPVAVSVIWDYRCDHAACRFLQGSRHTLNVKLRPEQAVKSLHTAHQARRKRWNVAFDLARGCAIALHQACLLNYHGCYKSCTP